VIDRCCICKRNGESVDNLLLHCEVACALQNVFRELVVGGLWQHLECCCVEDGASLPLVVPLEENER
jgi:hypothetical protein